MSGVLFNPRFVLTQLHVVMHAIFVIYMVEKEEGGPFHGSDSSFCERFWVRSCRVGARGVALAPGVGSTQTLRCLVQRRQRGRLNSTALLIVLYSKVVSTACNETTCS